MFKKVFDSFCNSVQDKMFCVLSHAAQGICLQQACEKTGLFCHSQSLLLRFKSCSLKELSKSFFETSLEKLRKFKKCGVMSEVTLAVDITEVPYYGNLTSCYIWSRTPKDPPGATGHYKYLVISVVRGNIRIILYCSLLGPGYCIHKILGPVLKAIAGVISVKVVLFDRGFASKEMVYELEEQKLNYIIFWRKHGWSKKMLDQMLPGDMEKPVRTLKFHRKGDSFSFDSNFVVLKKHFHKGKSFDWIFATNMKFDEAKEYVISYKKRWGIETTFRVAKQDFRIKTTSVNPSVRIALFIFSAIFYNSWIFARYLINDNLRAKTYMSVLRKTLVEQFDLTLKFENELKSMWGLG